MNDELEEDDSIIQEFLIESYENLDALDSEFVGLERDPGNVEVLSSIFRTIHTIKGTSGFLAFSKLETVTHRGENLLSQLRDGEKRINPEITNGLLGMIDAVRDILASIEESGNEGDGDYTGLIANLERLTSAEPADSTARCQTDPEASESAEPEVAETEAAPASTDDSAATPDPASAPQDDPGTDPADPLEVDSPAEPAPGVVAKADAQQAAEQDRSAPVRSRSIADSSIRVDVALLDKLMNLVGELVLARNQVVQYSAAQNDSGFMATCQRLNLITTELQEGVMKTRMQPIEHVWSKFPRIVRDLANNCEKQVTVQMEGKETELDKTILEAIKDPLTHIVRNSVDHGVESPEVRVAAGKSAEGRLLLRAYHEGGMVNIEIADDGGGIDPVKLKAKALEKNVITPERAAAMTDREVVNLIFEAGFSTAAKVTNVSGRGVGMDVVRSNVEKIGGTVDVQSKLGQGTSLKIKIPLTLAIIPALIVSNEGARFAIPQVSLLELVRLDGEQNTLGIEMIHGTPVYRLRGKLLPIVYLRKEFACAVDPESEETEVLASPDTSVEQLAVDGTSAVRPGEDGSGGDVTNIVVLQADDHQFGLVVDSVHDTEEIVVKPLGDQLKALSAFAGATIMGDGNVALILDVMGLAQGAKIVTETAQEEESTVEKGPDTLGDSDTLRSLLVIGLGSDRKMAIDLSLVARLEEFKRSKIEWTGSRQAVVQYRERIMPLVSLPELFGIGDEDKRTEDSRDSIHVVVYKTESQSIGLVVDEIVDIVEENIRVEHCSEMAGLVGTAIVHGEVTDLIDVEAIVRSEIGVGSTSLAEAG